MGSKKSVNGGLLTMLVVFILMVPATMLEFPLSTATPPMCSRGSTGEVQLEAYYGNAVLGTAIEISGSVWLWNSGHSSGSVVVYVESKKTQTVTLDAVIPNADGTFRANWTPLHGGSYSLTAVLTGVTVEKTMAGEPVYASGIWCSHEMTLNVSGAPSSISISTYPSSATIDPLSQKPVEVTVTGHITPRTIGQVYLSVMGPNEMILPAPSATTETDGRFSISFLIDRTGAWRVMAYWTGNDDYLPSSSDTVSIAVGNSIVPSPGSNTPYDTTSLYALVVIVLVIVMTIIALVRLLPKKSGTEPRQTIIYREMPYPRQPEQVIPNQGVGSHYLSKDIGETDIEYVPTGNISALLEKWSHDISSAGNSVNSFVSQLRKEWNARGLTYQPERTLPNGDKHEAELTPKVLALLLQWRREIAAEQTVSEETIFRDIDLQNIAIQKPRTEDELRTVPGINLVTATVYGKELLKVIALAEEVDEKSNWANA